MQQYIAKSARRGKDDYFDVNVSNIRLVAT